MRAALATMARANASRWQWFVVLHQRHPLDALVSQYHSFGWSHPASPEASDEQRRQHELRQGRIRNQTVDDYVLAGLDHMRQTYAPYFELLSSPPPSAVLIRLRYEDMVCYFEQWLSQLLLQLRAGLGVEPIWLQQQLLEKHRSAFDANGKHKRSVVPGSFVRELRPSTMATVLTTHRQWLGELGYT